MRSSKRADGSHCPGHVNAGGSSCSSHRSASQTSQGSGWIRTSSTGGAAFFGRGSPGLVSRLYGQAPRGRAKDVHQDAFSSGGSHCEAKAAAPRRSASHAVLGRPPRSLKTHPGRCSRRASTSEEVPSGEAAQRERLWSSSVLQSMASQRRASRKKRCDQLEVPSSPSVVASPIVRLRSWRKIKTGELPSPIKDLAKCAFASYDADGDGKLSPNEFGLLLRDAGFDVEDCAAAREAVELVAGPGELSLGFESFSRLLAYDVKKNFGYTEEGVSVLGDLFGQYDMNESGCLEVLEYSSFLEDFGFAPHTKEASQKLGTILASCRDDGQLGPLSFDEFVRLVTVLGHEEPGLPKDTGACSLLNADECSKL